MTYALMYRDMPVLKFDTGKVEGKILHPHLMPISIANIADPWQAVKVFCAERMLMSNRKYCKEILDACEINDQSDVGICTISKALSFRDNFWIKDSDSLETWKDINLYENEFSLDIAYTALTGEIKSAHIGDRLYTGELTNKGTRAKCFFRDRDGIYLAKAETKEEIASEIVSTHITEALNISATRYIGSTIYGKDCSVCKIQTSPVVEMIPCRDLMLYHGDKLMNIESGYYEDFSRFAKEFLKLQLFDYITLNTDRNRDNFGLKKINGKMQGVYPLFDHDSCFKGKSTAAGYFVTGMSFKDSLVFLRERFQKEYREIELDLKAAYDVFRGEKFKELFLEYKDKDIYEGLMARTEDVLK